MQAMSEKTIKSAFKNTGIIPFNPDIVLENEANFLTLANFPASRNQTEAVGDDEDEVGEDDEIFAHEDADGEVAEMLLHLGGGMRSASHNEELQTAVHECQAQPSEQAEHGRQQAHAMEAGNWHPAESIHADTSPSTEPNQSHAAGASLQADSQQNEHSSGTRGLSLKQLQSRMNLDPVQAQALTLPMGPPPQCRRVTENQLVNANRLLTTPTLLALKRQLEEEKREKESLVEERKLEREKRRLEKEIPDEEKKRKQEKRERQRKENELKAQREKEDNARRQEEHKREREERKRREEEEKEARRMEREEAQRRQREEKARREEERKRKKEQQEAEKAAKKASGQGKKQKKEGAIAGLLDESSRDSLQTYQAAPSFH
jgi:hypothetical protein